MRRTDRVRLLKTPPHLLTDHQLRYAAAYVVTELVDVGRDRTHALIRELRRRFGLSDLEIVETTGLPLYVVHAAMHGRPPRLQLPRHRPDFHPPMGGRADER